MSIRVFIVEDDPIILSGYMVMLKKSGHEIVGHAKDGETAVKKVLETSPDIVIMDINLPVMDGLTAIELINKEKNIPCIVITGYNNEQLLDRASQIGVYGYLQKPIDENNIKSAINIALNRFSEFQTIRNEMLKAKDALEARKYIERAKGILMDKFGLKEEAAMKHIQNKSRNKNKKLVEIALEIIKADKLMD